MEKKNSDMEKDFEESTPQKNKLKSYSAPELTKMGAMQKYTLGGSVGTGDSGSSTSECWPGHNC